MTLKPEEVLAQSKNAMKQWEDTWRYNAKLNGEKYRAEGRTQKELLHLGAGKTLLCVATGPSFEKQLDIIKEHKDKVDIACVDKCMGELLKRDIKPDYVFIADAGIDYKKWCKPWIEKTKDVLLLSNVTVNPEWTKNWKGKVYFYVNKDNIQTEKIFSEISGCNEIIPASSNVGNSVIVFSNQILGYDRYLLSGYDYCWAADENYYAFHPGDGSNGKRYWMNHMGNIDPSGRFVNTSGNLLFSARWLADFIKHALKTKKIINCSGGGILNITRGNLERCLKKSKTRKLSDQEKQMIVQAKSSQVIITPQEGDKKLQETLSNNNVINVIVNTINKGTLEWLETR